MRYVPNIEKVKEILSQGSYSLVDEFESEILDKLLEKETDILVICGCGELVRNAFYLTVAKFGKEATLSNFCEIILDRNYCTRTCMEVSIMHDTKVIELKTRTVVSYFFDEYYDTSEYNYCIPVRSICKIMLESELIAKGLLQFLEDDDDILD